MSEDQSTEGQPTEIEPDAPNVPPAEPVSPEGIESAEPLPAPGHKSHVTDLTHGQEVDPLTDARPVPIVEKDHHDDRE